MAEGDGPGGTFETSWRAFAAEFGWSFLFGGVALAAILWWLGELEARTLWFVIPLLAIVGAGFAVQFAVFGVRRVEIRPDRVTVWPRVGRTRTALRSELVQARQEKYWVVRTQDVTLRIRDLGFAFDDWIGVSQALSGWKVQQEAGPVPSTHPDRGGTSVVFEVPRYWLPPAIGWVMTGGGLLCLIGFWPGYVTGEWARDPLVTVGIPAFLLSMGPYQLWLASCAVVRLSFGAQGIDVEPITGEPFRVPYASIRDAHAYWIDTDDRTLYLGTLDLDVVNALLTPRLADDQLSGERWLRWVYRMQWPLWIATAVGGGAVWWLATTLSTDASPKVVGFIGIAALVVYVLLVDQGIRLWARRSLTVHDLD